MEILRNKRMAVEMGRLMRDNTDLSFFFAVGLSHVNYNSPKNLNILDHLKAGGFHIERVHPGDILTSGSVYFEDIWDIMVGMVAHNMCQRPRAHGAKTRDSSGNPTTISSISVIGLLYDW